MTDAKKAYGLVTAIGTKLGERAREDSTIVDRLKAVEEPDAFRLTVRVLADGLLPDAVVTQFVEQVVTDEDWVKWRSRLVLQVKMVRDGKKPAPGHESGRGVTR